MGEVPADSILHTRNNSVHADRVQKTNSTSPGSSNSNNNGLNPRSCVICRKRKVKCDKKHPCSNCSKARIECVFPSPGRAPRKPRKAADGELMERIRRLEGMVQTMGSGPQDEEQSLPQMELPKKEEAQPEATVDDICKQMKALKKKRMEEDLAKAEKDPLSNLESRFGRLVVEEGRSRYIRPSFWASLSSEVEDIKGILNDFSDEDDEDYPSPAALNPSASHQGFIFGFSSQMVDLLSLHPPPDQVPLYWSYFRENIDPLVKALHVPTIEPTILEAKDRLDRIHKGLEVLMFAMYYSSITSVETSECLRLFGEERETLLARYRFGCEQALARADFLQTDEVIVLQGFVIFLIALRRNDDARIIWTLTGLVVRMAQTLGLHRDGSHYALSPFDVEMRRRLWWQICILDSRASEDHGCDPTIIETSFDTQMPLNVNDEDLDPTMKELPQPKVGCTEMTFGLIRFEIASTLRRIQYVPPGPKKCVQYLGSAPLERKLEWITECHKGIEERYLTHCDVSVPLYWVVATVSRLIMAKMWLMVYHPYQRLDGGASLPPDTRDRLFITSLENVEYSVLLETEARTRKWGWLFRTYPQWHAIAFLLAELCERTQGEHVERAWAALEITTDRLWGRGSEVMSNKMKSHLWKPLRKLMAKAKVVREQALAEQIAQSQGAGIQDESMEYGFLVDSQWPLDFSAGLPNWLDTYQPLDAPPILDPVKPMLPEAGHGLMSNFSTLMNPFQPLDYVAQTQTETHAKLGLDHDITTSWLVDTTAISNQGVSSAGIENTVVNGVTAPDSITGVGNASTSHRTSFNASTNSPLMESPTLTDDAVNWANWDDMVREFGTEVDRGPTAGGVLGFPTGGVWY